MLTSVRGGGSGFPGKPFISESPPFAITSSSSVGCGSDRGRCAVRMQHVGDVNRPVVALVVLDQRDDRPLHRQRRSVERVYGLRTAPLLGPEAHVQAARLVVGGVRARDDLPVALLSRKPRLEVVLL